MKIYLMFSLLIMLSTCGGGPSSEPADVAYEPTATKIKGKDNHQTPPTIISKYLTTSDIN